MSQSAPPPHDDADPYFTWNPPAHGVRTAYLTAPSSVRTVCGHVCGPCADRVRIRIIWNPSRYNLLKAIFTE